MTLTIQFTPQEEAWLAEQAAREGVQPAEVLRQLVAEHLPHITETPEVSPTQAIFAQWAKEDATPGLDAKALEAIAYLEARIEEGKSAAPEEVRRADLEIEELKRNLNANRAAAGERLVFP